MSSASNKPEPVKHDLPANLRAERAILGSILLYNERMGECKLLNGYCFALDSNCRIFDQMRAILDKKEPLDIIILTERLSACGEIDAVGGVAYLFSLTELLPRLLNVEAYAKIVYEKWRLRQIIKACSMAIDRAYEQDQTSAEILTLLRTDIKGDSNAK
jgi:replicative DNA helicase